MLERECDYLLHCMNETFITASLHCIFIKVHYPLFDLRYIYLNEIQMKKRKLV